MGFDYNLRPSTLSNQPLVPSSITKVKSSTNIAFSRKIVASTAQFSETAAKTSVVGQETLTSSPLANPKPTVSHKMASEASSSVKPSLFKEAVNTPKPSLTRSATAPAIMTRKDASQDREWQFRQLATRSGIDPDTAKQLYQISGGKSTDTVTGFLTKEELELTKESALTQAEKNGNTILQIDLDVENLASINKSRGGSEANETISDISKILKNHLEATGVKLTSFRALHFVFKLQSKVYLKSM